MGRMDVVQSHMEALMQEFLGVDVLSISGEGDVPVRGEHSTYWARVRDRGEDPHIEIFSIVIFEIDKDPGLLEAINDVNRDLAHCRMFWHENRLVIAGEIVGASADVIDLACLCNEVATAADKHGRELAKVFGGKTSCSHDEDDT